MNALVGYTGFVGSNIYTAGTFDAVYNSKNINEAYGINCDLLFYAGLRAEKYLANSAPEKDMELIRQAEENISKINPKNLVLISTIDVFKNPVNVNENSIITTEGLHPYGYNRYQLELWVRERYPNALIIRLPALFGKNIKKNFIYDYINVIPFMLSADKMKELILIDPEIKKYYILMENGLYKLNMITAKERSILKNKFVNTNFSALNFTDSRSRYQFYNLNRLWDDIQTALKEGIRIWHPATEPVSACELYKYLTSKDFINVLNKTPSNYNYQTIYSEIFGGNNGYICDKNTILKEIKTFIKTELAKQ